jgi:hypothetical protein
VKRYVAGLGAAFLAGAAFVIAVAFHAGPEFIVKTGLRYAAASQDWDWQAVPKEAHEVSYSTRDLVAMEQPAVMEKAVAKATAKRGKK